MRTKGALSQKTVKLMVFTLIRAASKTWRRLNGANQLPRVIEGVKFTDGVANSNPAKISAAKGGSGNLNSRDKWIFRV